MAVSEFAEEQVPEAEVRIPTEWLMPWLDLQTVRQAQRPDTRATLTSAYLRMIGLELTLERHWVREEFWRRMKETVAEGYIYRSSAVELVMRGERRDPERERPTKQGK